MDPQNETLTVLRWTPDGYLDALTAGRADRVRAEPFEATDLPVGVLFGDEEYQRAGGGTDGGADDSAFRIPNSQLVVPILSTRTPGAQLRGRC